MDNEVEFQNSAFNDWNILSIIGRIDVATAASVEETAAAVVNSAKKKSRWTCRQRITFPARD